MTLIIKLKKPLSFMG